MGGSEREINGADRAAIDASLAEFAALRQEIQNRSGAQHRLLNLNITATAAIVGVVATRGAAEPLLLLLTFVCPALGMLWADHARVIGRLGRYIDGEIRLRVEAIAGPPLLGWEVLRSKYFLQREARTSVVFRLPLLVIFVGPALAALALTPFRDPSVSGSFLIFWACWVGGVFFTATTLWVIAVTQFAGIPRSKPSSS